VQITQLGRTGLKVSRLCLGTMNFGPRTSEEDAHQIMAQALENGVSFFDTADIYGPNGFTEEIVGRWLQTEWIDVYQMHHVERTTPWEEIWQAMEVLIAQGKVIYVGSSNFAGWHVARAQEVARARGTFGLVSEQSLYNLMSRSVEDEVLPACQYYGIGVIPWSPLNRGVLGGMLKSQSTGRRDNDEARVILAAHRDQIEQWENFCAEFGAEPAEVATAWLLHQPAVTAPIVGPGTLAHLETALRAVNLKLDGSALSRLDEIWPGPEPAPESYAW
jgi:NDP-hexose C3-ketoreductase / dTDP-4-oxo-2-deoxy-alpha-D-pentos-2-ene 2,3-reductase